MKSKTGLLNAYFAFCLMLTVATAAPAKTYKITEYSKAKNLTNLLRKNMNHLLIQYVNLTHFQQELCTGMESKSDLQILNKSKSDKEKLAHVKNGLAFINVTLQKIYLMEQQDQNPLEKDFHSNLAVAASRTEDLISHVDSIWHNLYNTPGPKKEIHFNYPADGFKKKKWTCSVLKQSSSFLVWVSSVISHLEASCY
nr:PREDICTED: uncharacterized protein LOC107079780 isoform X2 [Lepisosteus oculatus]